jgi:hypothetical protein
MPIVTNPESHVKSQFYVRLIDPIEAFNPNQRGPSCGFYALSFVMQYWYNRQKKSSNRYGLTEPLPARSHLVVPQKAGVNRVAKERDLMSGKYHSLRQYGKANHCTAYGSMFNAASVVKAARGEGSQYAGQYDGKVFHETNKSKLVNRINKLLGRRCPVIIPFDVGNDGDPCIKFGERAHWTVIVGSYSDGTDKYFIHFHWGRFRYCKANDMATSCINLKSNKRLQFHKYEIFDPTDRNKVIFRDICTESLINSVRPPLRAKKLSSANMINLEFCRPWMITKFQQDDRTLMPLQGFNPNDLKNAGLCSNIVAVYPKKLMPMLRIALN